MNQLSLRQLVFNDCEKLLQFKYGALLTEYWGASSNSVRMPDDPREDIKRALAWKPIVKVHSKGTDSGHCYLAALLKNEGMKNYKSYANVLSSHIKEDTMESVFRVPVDQAKLAVERWELLSTACCECQRMLRSLHRNNEPWTGPTP